MEEGRRSGGSGFGALLREYRLAAGLSQEALAERARMSSHGVSALERGYRRTPQRETLTLLVQALALDDEQRGAFEAAATRTGLTRRSGTSIADGSQASGGISSLPLALTTFVGRDIELEEIGALLGEHRLVTLTGSGGVGKTQTALQVGSALVDADETLCFVGLAPLGGSSVVPTIASALGLKAAPDRPLLQTLIAYLRNKSVVLILDNCEHVVAEVATVVNALLVECASVRILATSREPLRVKGEYTYRLPSLSLPAAIALFTDRASAADHHFALNDDNAAAVTELCRRLDGIPLAIELAAARVPLLSVKAITERLRDRFRILTGGERTALPRQQTMRAAIDWSYDLLPDSEQRLFERLSVFAAGCTLATAAALYATEDVAEMDLLEALSSLVDKSLVVADFEGNEPRYNLLESFREYGREKLVARGEEDLIERRHALAWLAWTAQPPGALDVLEQSDLDNWKAALQWALVDRHDVRLGQRLAASFPAVPQMPTEAKRWVNLAITLIDEETPTELRADLAQAKAGAAFNLREHTAAVAACLEALDLYREVGSWRGIVGAQNMAGHALASLGRVVEAKALIEEALASARKMCDRRAVAWSLRCLGYASAKGGDFAAARNYLTEALPIYESDFHVGDLAYAINDLGMYQFCAGDAELAFASAAKMLAIAREDCDAHSAASATNAMSIYLLAQSCFDEAADRARETLQTSSDNHLDVLAAYALQHLAAVATLRPRDDGKPRNDALAYAARILGFVDAQLAAMGSAQLITQEQEYERVRQTLRDALKPDTLKHLTVVGAAMTQRQAVEEALRPQIE